MIEKKELLEIAKLNGLKPWQQEKHYIQAIILEILAEQPLVFKGGTYLWFFHNLPRFSEDLDFTVKDKTSKQRVDFMLAGAFAYGYHSAKEELPENLPEIVSSSLELFGIQNKSKTITNNATTLSFRISAKGPLNTKEIDECGVYVEASKRESIEEKPIPIKLDFPAYNLPTKRAVGMSLEELGAEKVRAIMTREKARDLYDLYFLIKKKEIAFNQELIDKKLFYYNEKFSKKDFLKKAKQKQDYFVRELKNIVFDEIPEFKEVMQKIQKWIR